MYLEAISDCFVKLKECLGVLSEVAVVIERGGVAVGAESSGPESCISQDMINCGLDDVNLVLAGEEVFAVDTIALTVLKVRIVALDIDEIMNTVPAHENRFGILGYTLGES